MRRILDLSRALPWPVKAIRGIAGATELGDQEPVLVIDVSSVVDDVLRRGDSG